MYCSKKPALTEDGQYRMKREDINILIGGAAGQGLVTIGQLLCRTLINSGYEVVVTQSYMSRIRGGHNTFTIRAATGKIISPRLGIDILVALNEETFHLYRHKLSKDSVMIIDDSLEYEFPNTIAVPFKSLSAKLYENTVALGVVASLFGINEKSILPVMKKFLGKKKAKYLNDNKTAFQKGLDHGNKNHPGNIIDLAPVSPDSQKMMMNGNEAIAVGALAGGLKFCSFYPMTPATSIVLNIIKHADEMGCVVEQAEDEISAINMAIGASYAGAPSMVATSGGGYALMTEGISLAGMTETPIVIAVAMRPGPATGLPTRTEQGDLDFVIHGGHGEFPRVIYAPGSIEECYELTQKAFHIAEKYQTPAFILTDQYLADSYRGVTPFAGDSADPIIAGNRPEHENTPYDRYEITENGISPRLLPGHSKHLVVADSDEHTGDGHITEDLQVRIQMVDKRLRKLTGITNDLLAPEYYGDDNPDILLLCWGSSKGAVFETVRLLQKKGIKAATLHFSQVWPLKPDLFMKTLVNAKEVFCVEGNATSQFAKLITRETAFVINKNILRYDGLPFTPEYIVEKLDL